MLHTIDNLARWSRGYLLTSPSLDEMIKMASAGATNEQAALCILSKNKGCIVNGKYSTVSQQRAKMSITTGIAPPYCLTVIRRGLFDDCSEMREETTVIEIDGEYIQRIKTKETVPMNDLITEFLD